LCRDWKEKNGHKLTTIVPVEKTNKIPVSGKVMANLKDEI
jgi:hypothetical protein